METALEFVESMQEGFSAGDTRVIAIAVALVVVLLTILLLLCRGRSVSRDSVLLVGLCDSGKTLIYNRLVQRSYVDTHTSIKENSGLYYMKQDNKGSLQIVDVPGHERLRYKFFDKYKGSARAIVFIIDAMTFQKELKDVAGFLYTLLTDNLVLRNAPPVLILCNKQDQAMAKGSKVIQALLEKEMNTLRVTQSAALEGIDKTANKSTFLGKRNKDFQFVDLKPLKVEFVECSARGAKDETESNLTPLEDWVTKIV